MSRNSSYFAVESILKRGGGGEREGYMYTLSNMQY